jgi:energy-converting hydrogenase A subunit R
MPSIFFDLEGPLSPQDNAYEVLGLAPEGAKVFEVISRYDDMLTLEGRANYEPGDTLKLIVPFLILHRISEKDIINVSKKAKIVPGARELISVLHERGWNVFIISTSYQQHAYNVASQVGVNRERVACTKMPLNRYVSELANEDLEIVREMEERILEDLYYEKDGKRVVRELDDFFFKKLRSTKLGEIFSEVTVVGGSRKVAALKRFYDKDDLSGVVAIGDSITDYKMLDAVKQGGGLAIAFNGNEYSIPYSSVAIASVDQRFSLPLLDAFERGGKEKAVQFALKLEKTDPKEIVEIMDENIASGILTHPPRYHCIEGVNRDKIQSVISIHKEYRMLVRGEAGKLG